jgi:hypothetical protein
MSLIRRFLIARALLRWEHTRAVGRHYGGDCDRRATYLLA